MNGMNFTQSARETLAASVEDARRRHHEYVGTEHMLSAMLRNPANEAARALTTMGVDVASVRQQLDAAVPDGTAASTQASSLPYTSRSKNVLEQSMAEAREIGHDHMDALHLLAGILREEKGIAAQLLTRAGASREAVRARLLAHPGSPSARGTSTAREMTLVQVAVHHADGSVTREEFRDPLSAIHFLSGR